MTAKLIDGRALANRIKQEVADEVKIMTQQLSRAPGLAVVLVGQDPASMTYVNSKRRVCRELGLVSFAHDLPDTTTEVELLQLVDRLNQQTEVDGILVQLPLPPHIHSDKVIEAISPDKDVDGLHPLNLGWLLAGHPRFVSCTPAGIMKLIQSTDSDIAGKKAVVVGRSNMVGKPIAQLLLQANATVTMCHSRTQDLGRECEQADILVVAVGQKHCILGDWIKPGAVVIDVGMNRDESGLCGDVAFEQARLKAGYITPVPGGVGPMTITMLMANTLKAAKLKLQNQPG